MQSGEERTQKCCRPGPPLGDLRSAWCGHQQGQCPPTPLAPVTWAPSTKQKHEPKTARKRIDIQPAVNGGRAKLRSPEGGEQKPPGLTRFAGRQGRCRAGVLTPRPGPALPPGPTGGLCKPERVAARARGSLASSWPPRRGSPPPPPRTRPPARRGRCTSWWTQPPPHSDCPRGLAGVTAQALKSQQERHTPASWSQPGPGGAAHKTRPDEQ